MAANNLDFFNECLEGIGKRKLTDGQAENTYASYFRSSFNDDYAEAFSYNFGVNTKTIKLSINKDITRNDGWTTFYFPPLLHILSVNSGNRGDTYPYSIEDGGIAIGTGILSSISEFSAFGIVALEPIELQNHRVVEGYIKKKIQYSLLNNIDKEDKTSAYLQAKSMELESALIKALSQSTPNRYKIEAQISSEGIL
jgi:hypothetical protein